MDENQNEAADAELLRKLSYVPLRSRQVIGELLERFRLRFLRRAYELVKQRGSSTVTDADLHQAYRDVTVPTIASKVRRTVGDAAMILGGVLLPIPLSISNPPLAIWATTAAGAALIGIGLYIREFTRD